MPASGAFVTEYLVDLNAVQAAARAGCRILDVGTPLDYYVYGLIDRVDNSVFYVGKGHGKRWTSHYKEKQTGSAKHKRVQTAQGQRCVVIAEGLSESDAYIVERETINKLSQHLTNVTSGQNPPRSKLQRSKDECQQILTELPSFDVWIARAPRSEAQIKSYRMILAQLEKLAIHGDVEAIYWHRWNAETRSWNVVL